MLIITDLLIIDPFDFCGIYQSFVFRYLNSLPYFYLKFEQVQFTIFVSKTAEWVASSVEPDEALYLWHLTWVYTVCSGLSDQIHTVKYNIRNGHAQTGKIMTKSSAITNQLSITMAGLIIAYLFSSD